MSEVEVFGLIGTNRSIFSTLFLCGVLMPLCVVVVAYLFRNFSTAIRGAAMVSALIGVIMLTFFTTASQNAFFMMLTTLSGMAADGSESATLVSSVTQATQTHMFAAKDTVSGDDSPERSASAPTQRTAVGLLAVPPVAQHTGHEL